MASASLALDSRRHLLRPSERRGLMARCIVFGTPSPRRCSCVSSPRPRSIPTSTRSRYCRSCSATARSRLPQSICVASSCTHGKSLRTLITSMARQSSMQLERARIDRRFATMPGAVPSANGTVVTFRDEWSTVAQVFDLAKLGLSPESTMLFADAFRVHYAGAAIATRKGCWKALRTFARFVAEDGAITVPANLTTHAIGRYILWLDRQFSSTGEPWSISTRYGRFVDVKMLLTWAMRNRPGRLPTSLSFPLNPFPGRHRTPVPRRLSAPQLKAILSACYAEIDAERKDFKEGRR